jgi:hypothetical protein
MSKRWIVLPIALVLASAGCGDDGGGNSSDALKMSQAQADVEEFCSVGATKGDVHDRAYIAMLEAVRLMSETYPGNKDLEVAVRPGRPKKKLEEVVRTAAQRLNNSCGGSDGRQQAQVLERALQQQ